MLPHNGAERCLRGELDALVTAPVHKEAIIRALPACPSGKPNFFPNLANTKRTAMMLLAADGEKNHDCKQVAPPSIHISDQKRFLKN